MPRQLTLDVKDIPSFVRDVVAVLFVPGSSAFHLGERVALTARFDDGSSAVASMKVLGARHAASRVLGSGVFLAPERADDPALSTARDAARSAEAALARRRAAPLDVSVFFASAAEAESELRGLLDAAGAVLATGTAHQRGDRLAVTVVVGGNSVGIVDVVAVRVHVHDGVSGVVAVADDAGAVHRFLDAAFAAPPAPAPAPAPPSMAASTPAPTTTAPSTAPTTAPTSATSTAPSAFSLAPPWCTSREQPALAPPVGAAAGRPAPLSVLIVDDDADFCLLLRRALERRGHRVTTTDRIDDLVDAVVAAHPHVVVLDRHLHGATSDDALRGLASDARTASVPVLLTSAAPIRFCAAAEQHPCCRTFLKSGRNAETLAAIEALAAIADVRADEPRLLLAEDDDDVREEAAAWLEGSGFSISTAHDGSEAIRALVAGLRPAAIILDLMMPVLSGWAVYEWLRASPHARIPVIIWTAAGAATGTHMLRGARVVEKGRNPQLLLDTIRASTVAA